MKKLWLSVLAFSFFGSISIEASAEELKRERNPELAKMLSGMDTVFDSASHKDLGAFVRIFSVFNPSLACEDATSAACKSVTFLVVAAETGDGGGYFLFSGPSANDWTLKSVSYEKGEKKVLIDFDEILYIEKDGEVVAQKVLPRQYSISLDEWKSN